MEGLYAFIWGEETEKCHCCYSQESCFLKTVANSVKAIMVPTRLMRDIFVENGIDADLIHHVSFGIDTEPL